MVGVQETCVHVTPDCDSPEKIFLESIICPQQMLWSSSTSEKSNHEPEHFINVCIYASICPQKRGGSSECLREMDQGYFLVLSD